MALSRDDRSRHCHIIRPDDVLDQKIQYRREPSFCNWPRSRASSTGIHRPWRLCCGGVPSSSSKGKLKTGSKVSWPEPLAAPELVPGTGQGVLPMRRRIGINDMFVAVTLVVGPLYLERRLAKTFVIPTIEQSQLATIAR
jgi:hypothetical protein